MQLKIKYLVLPNVHKILINFVLQSCAVFFWLNSVFSTHWHFLLHSSLFKCDESDLIDLIVTFCVYVLGKRSTKGPIH